jgi:hypothetical protein
LWAADAQPWQARFPLKVSPNGRYVEIQRDTLANTGRRQFAPPARNSAGADDWVLVLQAAQ